MPDDVIRLGPPEGPRHPKRHAHTSTDGSGQVSHASLTNVSADQHHAKAHAHDGADGSGQVSHASLTNVSADQHHAQVHALSGSDHSGTLALTQHPTVPQVRVAHSADQSIPHATWTLLTFDTERYDTDGMHDPASPTTLTCRTAGLYLLWAAAAFATEDTGGRALELIVNGSVVVGQVAGRAANITATVLQVTALQRLAVNDTVTVAVYQDSGAALPVLAGPQISPEFGAVWLSP